MHKNGSLFILCVMLDPHGDSKLLMQQCKESLLMTEEYVLVYVMGISRPCFYNIDPFKFCVIENVSSQII